MKLDDAATTTSMADSENAAAMEKMKQKGRSWRGCATWSFGFDENVVSWYVEDEAKDGGAWTAEITPSNIIANINSIPMLNGTNFKSWQENLNIVLGVVDLDLALRVDSPPPLTDKSTSNEKREIKRWKRSDCMCMMIMKKAIPEISRGNMSDKVKTAKEFMAEIDKVFVKSEKSKIGILLTSLVSMRYQGKGNIREYIMQMSHLASKLKELKLDISEDFLEHFVLISLPPQFI
ncbi:uncharacterized protein [Nicotiana sylvestris]|uniref:uncharacterized protein n=1 Tax=Nicotiana sylvestris TaxID=4096 RepID=UPI00388C5F80